MISNIVCREFDIFIPGNPPPYIKNTLSTTKTFLKIITNEYRTAFS